MEVDLDHLKTWEGREERVQDELHPTPLALMSATLDRGDPAVKVGAAIPPYWHYLYFLTASRQSILGADGHPPRGGFLPPVPLPRRMFAGARVDFMRPLRVGEKVERRSTIVSVSRKQGRSGDMVFLLLRHAFSDADGVCMVEEQDIVYRDNPPLETGHSAATPTPSAPPQPAMWSRVITPDPVLLYRYSALTFNGHRIHYDHPYATQVEGYPGLVVHGPLQATLLLDLLRCEQPAIDPAHFAFRAVSPLYCVGAFRVCGAPAAEGGFNLWIEDQEGRTTMQAQVKGR